MLLIQKSILRDGLSDLAVHFFDKMKIMVVKDIEREDVDFLCKTIGCRPIASLDHFTAENMARADVVEEIQTGSSKCVKITGMATPGKTCSIIIRGSNKLVLEEALLLRVAVGVCRVLQEEHNPQGVFALYIMIASLDRH